MAEPHEDDDEFRQAAAVDMAVDTAGVIDEPVATVAEGEPKPPAAAESAAPEHGDAVGGGTLEPPPAARLLPARADLPYNRMLPPSHATNPFIKRSSFVVNWRALGVFESPEDGGGSLNHAFIADESSLSAVDSPPEGKYWRDIEASIQEEGGKEGFINIGAVFAAEPPAAAYAVALLELPEPIVDAKLCFGGDDLAKVWLNGQLVHAHEGGQRQADWDLEIVGDLTLPKGVSVVLVKSVNLGGEWGFFLRFTNRDGMPVCLEEK